MPQNNENRVLNAHSSEQAENRILNQDKETEKEKQEETQTISEQDNVSRRRRKNCRFRSLQSRISG